MTSVGRPPFREAVARAVRARDVALLLVVPAALVGVYLLPVSVRRSLSFRYAEPTLATAYTAHFVHLRPEHLLANVLSYCLLAGVGYLLASLAGRRRLFGTAAVTYLLAVPFALSGLNLAVPREAVGYGFSGVNMAFAGLLPLLLASYARGRLDARVRIRHAPGLFFAALALVALVALPRSTVSVAVAAVSGLAALAYAVTFARDDAVSGTADAGSAAGWLDLFAVGLVLFLATPFVAFPPSPGVEGGVLNLYAHLLGFCLAFIAPYVALELGLFEATPSRAADPTG